MVTRPFTDTVTTDRIKLKISGREVIVLGPGKRELLVSRSDTKRNALRQLAAFVADRLAEIETPP